jgi:acyl transferase domain-containing protein
VSVYNASQFLPFALISPASQRATVFQVLLSNCAKLQALNTAFFPDHDAAEGELLVGSIKTIIGHTEGCAGIAGILKACLAIQNSEIPPNLLFSRLNPALEPYVKYLRIPVESEPWPELPPGQPRRAR